jgi:hypothetical protein
MNYCSIQEAWGKHQEPNNKPIIEHFNRESKYTQFNCNDILYHIKTCPKCYNILKNYFSIKKPPILHNIYKIIDDNREIIVLILVGIFILLFFNLVNNITK